MCCDVRNVPHIQDMNTVSLLRIYLHGYSYDKTVHCDMKKIDRVEYANTVYLHCEFCCVLLFAGYFDNICRILCTCNYLCEYSYAHAKSVVLKNVSHIHHMNTVSLHCEFCYV